MSEQQADQVAKALQLLAALSPEEREKLLAQLQQPSPETSTRSGGADIKAEKVDIRGDVVGRDQIVGNVYYGTQPKDPAEALAIYRRVVAASCGQLPLRGIDFGAADPTTAQKPLGLANVYVDLDTTARVKLTAEEKKQREREAAARGEDETRPLGALEALIANRQLVLLGDPGGGKSTFVNHLSVCLALHALEPSAKWIDHLPRWPDPEAIPVVIILRDFARGLPEKFPRPDPKVLWDFVLGRLQAQNLAFAEEPLARALEEGRALILLDGLDEVPKVAQRVFVRDVVTVFMQRYDKNRFLITCRVLSYQAPAKREAPDLRLANVPVLELAAFDEAKIDRFVTAWYKELSQVGVVRDQDVDGLTRQLREAVRRPDLWRLANNPLLLTVMALVHTHKGRLPDARALLYEETVDILLWRWEQVKTGGQDERPPLRQLLLDANRTEVDLKRVLWQLAYNAHAQGKDDDARDKLADIGEWDLEKALAALNGDNRNWAREMIEAMKFRAGLLLERAPEVFTFPHRTFQEYLAGAHLAAQANFAKAACKLAEQGTLWREAILMAVGRLVYLSGDTDKPLALVGELCPAQPRDDDLSWRKAWLAGDALVEIGANRVGDSALGRDLLARVQQRLIDLLTSGRFAPRERATAGDTLAHLGDPRLEVRTVDAMAFCYVPPGEFVMGEGKGEEHTNQSLSYGYWISRYPITNAQFAAFVDAGGYGEARLWREAAAQGWWKAGRFKGRYDDTARDRPYDFGEPFHLLNHPVVGISWYEALAFTRWLTERGWRNGWLKHDWHITLPSESEWEKAARGGAEIPAQPVIGQPQAIGSVALRRNELPRRVFIWGDAADPNRANYDESRINATNAVGCFSGGRSVYGCEEMLGNVWEWTRSLWGEDWQKPSYPYPYNARDGRENLDADSGILRVVRGGAFLNNERYARCAYRDWCYPGYRNWYYGIRVVALPL